MNAATVTLNLSGQLSLSTEEFASGIKVQPQSIRKRYSQTGSYFDIRPRKLKNRRLAWPADAIEKFLQS
jgi:hypothetical protein